ncbi:hypothetical protein ACFLY2_02920 [Patescibacteria group bacterium]
MKNDLKMPMAGYRNWSDASLYSEGFGGQYWSSSPNGIYGYYMTFASNSINPISFAARARGYHVRCFKN